MANGGGSWVSGLPADGENADPGPGSWTQCGPELGRNVSRVGRNGLTLSVQAWPGSGSASLFSPKDESPLNLARPPANNDVQAGAAALILSPPLGAWLRRRGQSPRPGFPKSSRPGHFSRFPQRS